MVKYNEVRIGNLVDKQGKTWTICAGNFLTVDLSTKELLGITPIPLTDEWLARCGFEDAGPYERADLHIYVASNIDIAKKGDEYYLYITYVDDHNNTICGNPFRYLHQLQNLFFALTGEELTIKV